MFNETKIKIDFFDSTQEVTVEFYSSWEFDNNTGLPFVDYEIHSVFFNKNKEYESMPQIDLSCFIDNYEDYIICKLEEQRAEGYYDDI